MPMRSNVRIASLAAPFAALFVTQESLMNRFVAAFVLFGLFATPAAQADRLVVDTPYASIVIEDRERALLRDYYRAEAPRQGLNKGMQKRLEKGKGLPPGWQKKLTRGRAIPADIWAWHEVLPYDVLRRLPPQPEGVITVRIDSQIVRVVAATQVLLDVFGLD